ncbi:DUF1925 domain-containing protein [Coprothermobacteraceae bacterium]|nr:DUF1925 domain-containing protein [Coprothermobacteraceae bacterium]
MGKIYLSWVIHNHQPDGNFPWVIDYAYDRSYKPFLELLEKTGLKAAIHNSGTLWEYFEDKAPEYVSKLKTLVDSGQVELLGGTIYEAILSMIPDADKHSQLWLLKQYIEHKFETPVNGAWVTERVWEPHFPKFYQEAGYQYVFLDDYHFALAGELPPFHGYYLTEDQGYQLFVFPINKDLRYLIPWHSPKEVLRYLEKLAKDRDVYLVYGDDGEKFGLWPGTYSVCYEDGYLESLISELSEAGVEFVLPSEIIEQTNQTGLVYLPTGTYPEMSEWALEPEALRQYETVASTLDERDRIWIHAGFWRQFLKRHPETRWMYGRMVWMSRYLNSLALRHPRKNKALQELYRAQANDVFWHGVFGGLFLSHLRRNVYKRLIRAKVTADGRKSSYVEVQDFDMDGQEEVLFATPLYHAYVDLEQGLIRELDLLSCEDNLMDVLDPDGTIHGLFRDLWNGSPVRYSNQNFNAKSMRAYFKSESAGISKELVFDRDAVSCVYRFKHSGTLQVELPLNLWDPRAFLLVGTRECALGEEHTEKGVSSVSLEVGRVQVLAECQCDGQVDVKPIFIEHSSEHGTEATYQGTLVTIQLAASEGREVKFVVRTVEGEVGQ